MLDRNSFMKLLKDEIASYEKQIKWSEFYYKHVKEIEFLQKKGLKLDFSITFLLLSVLAFHTWSEHNNNPFFRDEHIVYARVVTTNTSTGFVERMTTFDSDFCSSFFHTTGWELKENGLYEMTKTIYEVNDEDVFNDIQSLLFMSKNDTDELFQIIDIETLRTNNIDYNDQLYTEDMLVTTTVATDFEQSRVERETALENLLDFGCYVGINLFITSILYFMKKRFIISHKHIFDKKLEVFELHNIKKLVELKKENYQLLNGKDFEQDDYLSYQLKKGR